MDDDDFTGSDVATDVDYMLVRDAATEVASAYGEQRDADEERMARWPLAALLLKMWDATLDRRACPRCKGLDGQLQMLGFSYVGGAPGRTHPNCRCVSVLAINRDLTKPRAN